MFLVTIYFLTLSLSASAQLNDDPWPCISSYGELKEALRDKKSHNVEKLLEAFYPLEATASHVRVTYHFEYDELFSRTFTFHWIDRPIALSLDISLINALSFFIGGLHHSEIDLVISPPFCSNVSSIVIWMKLRMMTVWLKSYANGDLEIESKIGNAVFVFDSWLVTEEFGTFYFFRDQYLRHYRIPLSLLCISVIIMFALSYRFCSPKWANNIDAVISKIYKTAVAIATSIKYLSITIDKDEFEDETRPILTKLKAKNILTKLLVFTAIDAQLFILAEKHSLNDWIVFFPIPLIAPLIFLTSCLLAAITHCIVKRRNNARHIGSPEVIKQQIFVMPFISALSVYILYHGYWMIIILGAYPNRAVLNTFYYVTCFIIFTILLETKIFFLPNKRNLCSFIYPLLFFILSVLIFFVLFTATVHNFATASDAFTLILGIITISLFYKQLQNVWKTRSISQ